MLPQRVIRSGDVELALCSWQAAPAASPRPLVVLVHGYPDSAEVWAAAAEHLVQHCDVVAYDVRGAGSSSRPRETSAYALRFLVEDLGAVVDAVSPQRPVHLVGHDWGSLQLWEAVSSPRLHGRIASFTSISGPCLDHVGHWIRGRLRSGSPRDLRCLARQLARSWYIGALLLGPSALAWKLGLGRLWPTVLRRLEGLSEIADRPTQREDGIAGSNLYRANVRQRLLKPQERRTEVPVQLLVPQRDHFMINEIFEDVPRWTPQLWRSDINAGHWVQLSHPEWVAGKIATFVDFVEHGEESSALRRLRSGATRGKHSGKLVVITGAGSGIGRETAFSFAEGGADIVVCDVNPEAAERTAELCRLLNVQAWAQTVDVSRVDQLESLVRWVSDEFGAPDVVVNNAGIGLAGPVLDTGAADWERILRINLGGVIHGSRLFAAQMVAARKRGHIVNVSSGLAFFPNSSTPAYATTKAAVRMFTECLRMELASQGIGVSAIYPGLVNTGIVHRTRFVGREHAEEQRQQSRAQRLYGLRNLPPRAVAQAIIDAVQSNKAEVLVGAEVHGIHWLSRYLPGVNRQLARINVS
jgi:NAD(P)-dependent dehydrogenase (short-subunit alcohol dehydrogenase family)/pimeloyl-ACP methyl ester carboxylesterase